MGVGKLISSLDRFRTHLVALLAITVIAVAAVPQFREGNFYPIVQNPGFENCEYMETEDGLMPMPEHWKLTGGAMILGEPGPTDDLGVAGNVCMLFHRRFSRIEQREIQVKPGVTNVIVVLLRPMHGAQRRTVEVGYVSDAIVPELGRRELLTQSLLSPYHSDPPCPWGNTWAYQEFRFVPSTSQGTLYLQGDCGALKIIRPVIVY